ncbi:DNA-3-methyladenine glycosylase family protein [Chitinibacteraceae bacterium HSL-7]
MGVATGRPVWWDEACRHLAENDATMARLIAAYPDVNLHGRGDAFMTLARSIVGQQISVKAADSVWARFAAAVGEVTPVAVLAQDVVTLRSCGLSQRKAEYMLDLASHAQTGVLDGAHLHALPDEAIIAELTQIRGIGRWTVEMFLIFFLMRPDVLPLDDIGLLKAVALHYHDGERRARAEVRTQAEAWRPYATAATWYLWRSLDPVPVSY